ncbi:MAG: hypothetical protein IPH06_03170 [Alphaproteobacteria bacterium]|nr:hypothetical protein [Alphaproteobacteria bacterium]QQS57041.1 MAG: hypothetical protein IPN28_12420 [Alphaproteobacteria bacterium]
MNPIEKIDRSHRQSLVLHGFCLMLFFVLFYVNYNLPVFAQIVAHYTYVPVELEDSSAPLQYGELSYCWSEPWYWRWWQNTKYCGQKIPTHTYKVSGREYTLIFTTYTFEAPHRLSKTAYYSFINPAWSVADNRIPTGKIWTAFVYQTIALIAYAAILFMASSFALGCKFSAVVQNIYQSSKKMSFENSVILSGYSSVCVSMLCVLSYHLTKTNFPGIEESFLFNILPSLVGIIFYVIYAPKPYLLLGPAIVAYLFFLTGHALYWCPLALIIHLALVLIEEAVNKIGRLLKKPTL